jgi:hypothetical protein
MTACESFLEKYTAFGREPSLGRYLELFDPEGTVLHPGMPAPIGIDQIPGFISRALATLRGYRLEPVRWCAHGDTIFVEARNSATIGGKRAAWPAIYCITLRGDRVLRGRAHYDRIGVLSHLDAASATGRPDAHLKVLEPGELKLSQSADGRLNAADIFERFVLPYAHYWKNADPRRFPLFYHPEGRLLNPGLERPLGREEIAEYYARMKSKIPDVRCELEAWAASAGLVFLE